MRAVDNPGMASAQAQFESLLFEPMFAPLECAFGDYAAIAERAFTDALAKALQ